MRGGDRDSLAYEVSFDGAVRSVRGLRVAGAGAVLWSPLGAGGRRMLARTVVALPGVDEAVVEAVREMSGLAVCVGEMAEVALPAPPLPATVGVKLGVSLLEARRDTLAS